MCTMITSGDHSSFYFEFSSTHHSLSCSLENEPVPVHTVYGQSLISGLLTHNIVTSLHNSSHAEHVHLGVVSLVLSLMLRHFCSRPDVESRPSSCNSLLVLHHSNLISMLFAGIGHRLHSQPMSSSFKNNFQVKVPSIGSKYLSRLLFTVPNWPWSDRWLPSCLQFSSPLFTVPNWPLSDWWPLS